MKKASISLEIILQASDFFKKPHITLKNPQIYEKDI
jgi:hypothetical protein